MALVTAHPKESMFQVPELKIVFEFLADMFRQALALRPNYSNKTG